MSPKATPARRTFLAAAFAAACLMPCPEALGSDAEDGEWVLMRVRNTAPVRRSMQALGAVMAKIAPGAVVKVRRRGGGESCPAGWMQRESGGFICAKNLEPTDETVAHPAPEDLDGVLDGLDVVEVVSGKPLLYARLKDIKRDRPYIALHKGSALRVVEKLDHLGKQYYRTRQGWFVEAEGTSRLPEPLGPLGIEVKSADRPPLAIVVSENTPVFSEPDASASPKAVLERWKAAPLTGDDPLTVENGWVELPGLGYASDEHLARVRKPPALKQIGSDERWLAVDLDEQLLHAYEGERLVKLIPCSTGVKDNTLPGLYRIQWKIRMSNMRVNQGHVRIEDVKWVMYYDYKNRIAIHSAFWHDGFGKPMSHGCVNLPPKDAEWVFEWTSPGVSDEDSERFPVPGQPGSRVVVFRSK